jgi:outer membrane protein assembly factor BamB
LNESAIYHSMKYSLVLIAVIATVVIPSKADDWPQWRGPQRNGISQEKGLLKEWPKDGPKLLWTVTNAGSGYSTPAVVGDRLYLLGNEGMEKEFVEAIAVADGKRVWSTPLGKVGNPNQRPNYPAARSTPTVDGDVLYALGSDGGLACVEIANGKVRWHKNLRTDFAGKPGEWAYAESPLVDGDLVICTPGGSESTMVGLNKKTGAMVWQCAAPGGDQAAYSSAILVDAAGAKQCVQLLQKGLVGVGAGTGKFLWRYPRPTSKYNANIPTPVASGDLIYTASAGTGAGLVKLKPKHDGIEVEEIYFESKLPTAIGGVIKIGNYLYGTTGQAMLCLEFETGKLKWEDRSIGTASLCFADGRLYLHGENGQVALVEASPDGYREKGRFTPRDQPERKDQSEKPWAFPVVANGHLYLRDHGRVWCYAVGESGGAKN